MGFFDAVGDLLSAAMPWSEVEAEAPAKEEEEKVCITSAVLSYLKDLAKERG